EALGAIAALEQESLPLGDVAEQLLQAPRLAGEDQRRIVAQRLLDRLDGGGVGVIRRLLDRLRPPAIGRPVLSHDLLVRAYGPARDGRARATNSGFSPAIPAPALRRGDEGAAAADRSRREPPHPPRFAGPLPLPQGERESRSIPRSSDCLAPPGVPTARACNSMAKAVVRPPSRPRRPPRRGRAATISAPPPRRSRDDRAAPGSNGSPRCRGARRR